MISKFNAALKNYINEGQLEHNGLPTVAQLAQQLFVSPRYLSDLLKQETGNRKPEKQQWNSFIFF